VSTSSSAAAAGVCDAVITQRIISTAAASLRIPGHRPQIYHRRRGTPADCRWRHPAAAQAMPQRRESRDVIDDVIHASGMR